MDKINKLKQEIFDKVAEYYTLTHQQQQKGFKEGETHINYSGRVFDEREIINLVDASLEFWLTYGRYSKAFEKKLAQFLGIRYCSMVNTGSSANLLAFMALTSPQLGQRQILRGDEVITVAASFPTTVSPIVLYGAIPVFVDIDIETLNIDVNQIEQALSPKTKAVMLAHSLGNPFDLDKIKAFCEANDLWLIEDNCDALGSKYKGKYTGTFADIGTSSFYPPHHITTGEGGAVYTDNKQLYRIINSMRDWGRDCWCESGVDNSCGKRFSQQFGSLPKGYDHKYVYSHFGYNLKATDLQAAIGLAQLDKLPQFIQQRTKNFSKLYDSLKNLNQFFTLPRKTPHSEPSWFGFWLTVADHASFTRTELTKYLEKNNIQTRNLFAGNLVRQPLFESLKEGTDYRIAGNLEITDKAMNNTFWVGVYPGMQPEHLSYISGSIRDFVSK